MSKKLKVIYRVGEGVLHLWIAQGNQLRPATEEDIANHFDEIRRIESKFKTATDALDRIACDPEHLKRDDMVQLAGDALCKVGLWRKAVPGEFVRGGMSFGFPGGEPQQKG